LSTTIEWTDETWNPVTGCTKVSPGCRLCYAKQLHDMRHQAHLNGKRMPAQYHEPFERVQCWPNRLAIPLGWRAPRLCFVNSMSDLFHEDVPFDFISQVLLRMALTPQHTYQVLTKRPLRMLEYFQSDFHHRVTEAQRTFASVTDPSSHRDLAGNDGTNLAKDSRSPCLCGSVVKDPLPNLWPGVSVEKKKYLGRLDVLRQVPAAVRKVSFEPLLEDLGEVDLQGIGWAIVGGESGRGARPFEINWANNLRIQCKEQQVPFFLKQWGSDARSAGEQIAYRDSKGGDLTEWPAHLRVREFPKPYPGHQVVRKANRQPSAASFQ